MDDTRVNALSDDDTDDLMFWIVSWWAMLPYEAWRFHDPDPLRPTENEAMKNIAYDAYVAFKYRQFYMRKRRVYEQGSD